MLYYFIYKKNINYIIHHFEITQKTTAILINYLIYHLFSYILLYFLLIANMNKMKDIFAIVQIPKFIFFEERTYRSLTNLYKYQNCYSLSISIYNSLKKKRLNWIFGPLTLLFSFWSYNSKKILFGPSNMLCQSV